MLNSTTIKKVQNVLIAGGFLRETLAQEENFTWTPEIQEAYKLFVRSYISPKDYARILRIVPKQPSDLHPEMLRRISDDSASSEVAQEPDLTVAVEETSELPLVTGDDNDLGKGEDLAESEDEEDFAIEDLTDDHPVEDSVDPNDDPEA